MRLGVLREPEGEMRVALVPNSILKLSKSGFEVFIEKDAGVNANHSNEEYEGRGGKICSREDVLSCETIVSIRTPDLSGISEGTVLICVADPFRNPDTVRRAISSGITLISMDMIPRRLSRAQSMDVNSSQDNLSGYKAVLMGASEVPKAIPMMTTSAGTVKPAKFVIMGSGVAGLQAIATAKRIGAIVYASDVRKSAAEQIESVGGRFIEVEGMDDFEDESGYAKPLTPEFIQKVNDTVCEVASDADVIVTTARIFGRPAPITIPESAVHSFKKGSVIVDMNADVGGNCELTSPGEIVIKHGVKIIGIKNLAGTIPSSASMLFSNNITNFVISISGDDGLILDSDDDILVGPSEDSDFFVEGMGGVLICSSGELHKNQTRLGGIL
tara:strand:+ start:52786 stop:53943 length:1158 start_codon:yes stop_codon:yes gene_type:complete